MGSGKSPHSIVNRRGVWFSAATHLPSTRKWIYHILNFVKNPALIWALIQAFKCLMIECYLLFSDEHRLSDYSIGPEAKLNLVIRPVGERTGASGTSASSSSSTQGGVWQTVSVILARHFSPADAAKVHEQLIKVYIRAYEWYTLMFLCFVWGTKATFVVFSFQLISGAVLSQGVLINAAKSLQTAIYKAA